MGKRCIYLDSHLHLLKQESRLHFSVDNFLYQYILQQKLGTVTQTGWCIPSTTRILAWSTLCCNIKSYYVAISRVTSMSGLKILLTHENGVSINSTSNVVFKEIFRNLSTWIPSNLIVFYQRSVIGFLHATFAINMTHVTTQVEGLVTNMTKHSWPRCYTGQMWADPRTHLTTQRCTFTT